MYSCTPSQSKTITRAPDASDLFPVRTIAFLGRDVPTLGQNEFGPCALLGVVNALLLRGTLKVSSDHGALTLEDVLARLADRLIEANQRAQGTDEASLNVRAALDGAVTRLPTIAEVLDVNVKFDGGLFEFTSDLALFDLLDVRLVHGWRVDCENDAATARALGERSYNACIEEIVALRSNELEGEEKARAERVADFLDMRLGVLLTSRRRHRCDAMIISFTDHQNAADLRRSRGDPRHSAGERGRSAVSEHALLNSYQAGGRPVRSRHGRWVPSGEAGGLGAHRRRGGRYGFLRLCLTAGAADLRRGNQTIYWRCSWRATTRPRGSGRRAERRSFQPSRRPRSRRCRPARRLRPPATPTTRRRSRCSTRRRTARRARTRTRTRRWRGNCKRRRTLPRGVARRRRRALRLGACRRRRRRRGAGRRRSLLGALWPKLYCVTDSPRRPTVRLILRTELRLLLQGPSPRGHTPARSNANRRVLPYGFSHKPGLDLLSS